MLRELNLDEVALVAGGFRFGEDDDGGDPDSPKENEQREDDRLWEDDDWAMLIGALIGSPLGPLGVFAGGAAGKLAEPTVRGDIKGLSQMSETSRMAGCG